MLTTIQDMGRYGVQEYGIPVGGVMDEFSATVANWLLGNEATSPILEITLMGPTVKVSGEGHIAVAGADFDFKINGQPYALLQTIKVKEGDWISFGKIKRGCRAYLAVSGQWQISKWLGSAAAATHMANITTPHSRIQSGDILEIKASQSIRERNLKPDLLNGQLEQGLIPVLAGPEFDSFSRESIGFFFSQKYSISADSNRMGYQLDPTLPNYHAQEALISSGTVPGTIQVSNGGKLIILMKDAQTTGGYPRIANVTRIGINRLAQLKPGDHCRFLLLTQKQAQQQLEQYYQLMNNLSAQLNKF